jgi:O-antigen ligase
VPLAWSPQVFRTFALTKISLLLAATAFLVAYWAVKTLLGSGARIRWSRLNIPVLVFGGLVVTSYLGSIHRATSLIGDYGPFEGATTYLAYVILYFVAGQLDWGPGRVRWMARALAGGGAAAAVYGLTQYLGYDWLNLRVSFDAQRSAGTFGNPTLLAGYLALVFPVAVVLALTSGKRSERAVFALAGAAIFLGAVTTFTRGGWPAMVLTVVVLLVWQRRQVAARKLAVTVGSSVILLLLLAMWLAPPTAETDPGARIKAVLRPDGGSIEARLAIWGGAGRLILERPVFGHGPDVFSLVFPKHQSEKLSGEADTALFDNAHSYPLQMAVTLGLPAALLFLALFAWHLWRGLAVFAAGDSLVPAMLLGAAAYFMVVLFEPAPFGATFIVWLVLGVVSSANSSLIVIPWSGGSKTARQLAVAAVAVAALAGVTVGGRLYLADAHFAAGNRHYANRRLTPAAYHFKSATALNPRVNEYFMGLAKAYTARREQTESFDDFRLEERALRSAQLNNPYRTANLLDLAEMNIFAAARSGDDRYYDEAGRWIDQALRQSPNSARPHYTKATLEVFRQRWPEALTSFRRALELGPDRPETHYGLGLAYQRLDRKEQAAAAFKEALSLDDSFREAGQALMELGDVDSQ